MLRSQNPATISDFIAQYPAEIQAKLEEMRQLVHDVCPEAEEKIAYGIPTFTWHGNLVHFSAYKTHIGFYPGSGPLEELKSRLTAYDTSKGTVRFPIHKPLPLDIIKDLTILAIERNQGKK